MTSLPLHFASPELAPLLWLWLGFTALLVLLERRGTGALDRLVESALQSTLVQRPADWRRWLRIGLLSLAALFMVLALMRPQWGLRFIATPRVGAEIMIALDVSRSMLADDAKPSRLERAKAEIADLLAYLDDDHVGLIAFAGRASVLSPMTPDRSFLRLVLDGAGPHSVSRGGTRLAEPIQKAIAGLGEAGPAQRALILITDGDDHDSFALDAAKQAGEAGIKIIAIGFGDEAGSEVYVTDPGSGARTLLRDGEGEPVVSRLGGDLLREIALASDGAYVPAGTGVLDLASIYDEHIAGLTRSQLDSRGRSIRNEIYAWFVLLAMLCLLAAVSVAAGRSDGSTGPKAALLAALLALDLLGAGTAEAQPSGTEPVLESAEPELAASELAASSPQSDTPAREPSGVDPAESPREMFNRAVEALGAGDLATAETLLREARSTAADDAELRYAATYNLGIATVARAEAVEQSEPQRALDALYEAADWFRSASSLRPDASDARHNLEVSLRKALVLADFLASQNQRGLEQELDGLLAEQRAQVGQAAALLEQVARDGELDASQRLRPAFAAAATAQRTLLADAADFGDRAAAERDAIAAMSEEERTPQDAMRAAQLDAVLHYLDAARERMGQTRSQLRKRSAERAYRRSSAALAELARARDQLRDPVEQIGVLLAEVGVLARASAALGASGQTLPGAAEPVQIPAFLTAESAGLDNDRVRARIEELATRFETGLETAAEQAASSDPSAPNLPPEQEQLLAAVAEATPFVSAAARGLESAGRALGEERYLEAMETQGRSGEALAEARERFLDLPQLLEAAYRDEQRIASVAKEVPTLEAQDEDSALRLRGEYADALRELQTKNLARGDRLEGKLKQEIQAVEDASAAAAVDAQTDPDAAGQAAASVDAQRERLGIAAQLLTQALAAMDEAAQALETGEPDTHWPEAADAAARSAEQLERMRTLFFSIVEHVRELARLQQGLADRTQDAAALALAETPPAATPGAANPALANDPQDPQPPPPSARGPQTLERTAELTPEQRSLSERAGSIGDALAAQAEQAAAAPPEQAGPDPEESARRLRLAGEHVVSSQLAMRDAADVLGRTEAPLPPALEHQTIALEEIEQALALLVPPEQQPQDQQQQDQQQQQEQQQQQQEQQEAGAEQAEASETPENEADPSQLLQGVRDREAERRRERERGSSRYEPVDKDW